MKKISRKQFIRGSLAAGVGLLLFDGLYYEKNVIDWNRFDIAKSPDKVKIIQISDLHLNRVRSVHRHIAEKINALSPDLVFLTGDSVDATEKIPVLDEFLQLIEVAIPKYAITGNWEYWGKVDLEKLREVFTQQNGELLINEHRTLSIRGRKVSIIGVDDYVGGQVDFRKAVENLDRTGTNIVLSHCPEHRDVIAQEMGDLAIELVLSGHTHGGQISFFGLAPFKPRGSGKYLKGWYKEREPHLYVCKGIGTSMIPIRLGAQAEVVEMEI